MMATESRKRAAAAACDVEAMRHLLHVVTSDVRSLTSVIQWLARSSMAAAASLVEFGGEWGECPRLFDPEALQSLHARNLVLMRSSLAMFNRLEEGLHYTSLDILDDVRDAQEACRSARGELIDQTTMPTLVQGMLEGDSSLQLAVETVDRIQSVLDVLHGDIEEMCLGGTTPPPVRRTRCA